MASRKLEVQIVGDSKSLERAFGRAADSGSSFGSKLAKAGKIAAVGFAALGAVAAVGLKKSIEAASDLNEQVNKAAVVFGKSGKAVAAWSGGLARNFGISSRAALEAAGTFGNMLVPMGFARDEAAKMSTKMVELAGDMSSFNNASPADTLEALRAGLAGESEPLRKFGVFLSDARLKAEAMAMGLYSGKGALDASAKAAATYSLILKDTKDAQGDFERTNTGLANAQRSIAASWENISASLGSVFLPVVAGAASHVADFMHKLEMAPTASAKFQVAMSGLMGVVGAAFTALKNINWGEVWNQLIVSVEQISPRMAAALSGLGTVAKTAFDGISSSWGQFIAASVAGAAVFAQAASRVVKAIESIRLGTLTLNPLFTALTILAGLTAGVLYKIVTSGDQVSAALKRAESALKSLKGAAEGAKGAEQNLAEAKNRLRQATLNVTDAIKLKQQAVDKEGKSSQQAKQAEANVEAAYLARRRAAMDVKSATEALDKAQVKSKDTTTAVRNSVLSLQHEYENLISKGPSLQMQQGRIGHDQEKLNASFERQSAKKYADDMTKLAAEAGKAAQGLQKTDPALAAIARGVQKAAKEQAKLATELGKIPPTVKKLEGPGRQAGLAVGGAIGSGMKTGIAQKQADVAAAARGLVNAAKAAADSAAQVKSPSKLFAVVGQMMGQGLAVGFAQSAGSVAATISGKTKALVNASIAEVARLQGILDGINAQRAAQDRARAVADAAAALADARKKGEGVLAAERELARARQDIVVAGLESQLAKEQAVQARREAALQAAQQRFQAIYDAAMSRYQSAIDKTADYVSRSFQAKTDQMVAAVGAKWDKLIAQAQAAGAKLTAQEKALQAFDAQAVPQTESEKALAALDAAEAERGRNAAVTAAQTALANAQQITDAKQKAEAITAAEEQLRVAELAITRAGLEERAAAEREAQAQSLADKRAALEAAATASREAMDQQTAVLVAKLEEDKAKEVQNLTERRNQRLTSLQQQFKDLQTWLAKHPKEYDKINEKVKKIMDAFGVDMKTSGENLGNAFANGLRASINEVKNAARAVAQAAANNMKLNSPAKEGPMSDLDRWWSPLASTLLSGLSAKPITAALAGAVSMPMAAAAPVAAGGGNTYVTVNMPNYLGDKREAIAAIRAEMKRTTIRNA